MSIMARKSSNPRAVGGSTRQSAAVLLVHDVNNLGLRGDIVRVKPGYARNYLLPHGLATIATDQNQRMVARHRQKLEHLEAGRIRDLQKMADAVSRYSATIEANATSDNTLYGSVVARDISNALKSGGHNVEPGHVKLDGPIKELGMYTVKLSFHDKVNAEVKVWVVPSAAEV
jgi:large subunit ribosomal protein L9